MTRTATCWVTSMTAASKARRPLRSAVETVTNGFARQITLTGAEWAVVMKGMDEFNGYLS